MNNYTNNGRAKPLAEQEDDDDDDNNNNNERDLEAWERAYAEDRSWESLQEDESGLLRPIDNQSLHHAQYRRRLRSLSSSTNDASSRIQKGLIRYLILVIDFSKAAGEMDLRPSRMMVVAKQVEAFIREFFDQNPLSQIGLVTIKDGLAHCLTDLGGSPESHIKALMGKLGCSGEASLQNALELVHEQLNQIPSYGHREVIILYSALSTCDPGDVMETIQKCKTDKIRCSVIGLSAELYICKYLCQETGGLYSVALDEAHLKELILEHAPPPPAIAEFAIANLIRMGFPQRAAEGVISICSCHKEAKFGGGYTCPRCKARVCELPTECRICGLTLVSSPHLARSYHHLFPVTPFEDVDPIIVLNQRKRPKNCFGCQQSLLNPGNMPGRCVTCPKCKQFFCLDCDIYIHESLHNCPGCESLKDSKSVVKSSEQMTFTSYCYQNADRATHKYPWKLNSLMSIFFPRMVLHPIDCTVGRVTNTEGKFTLNKTNHTPPIHNGPDSVHDLEAWERAYAEDRSWESLQEDESGLLRPIDNQSLHHAQYRRRLRSLSSSSDASSRIQKGLIRYLILVIDFSKVNDDVACRHIIKNWCAPVFTCYRRSLACIDLEAWERAYAEDRSWESLQEDESGLLRPIDNQSLHHAQYRRRLRSLSSSTNDASSRIQKGLIRYLILVIDFSKAAGEMDLRPSRMMVVAKQVEAFIREFFDQNPLSQIGLVTIKDGLAHCLTDLGGSPESHIKALMGKLGCSGEASLQNALELVHEQLNQIPSYGHREVIILYSALSTCDPGDVMETIQKCKTDKIRCSVIGLSAELYICKYLCQETGGLYSVALDEAHLKELILEHAPPPPAIAEFAIANLIRMGFPQRAAEGVISICSCHKEAKFGGGYTCPRCKARVCELPTECRICGLTLVSSPHLARSYHHLFPVTPFEDVDPIIVLNQRKRPKNCFGCQQSLLNPG
ncbi:general transcription factor II H2 [Artemisia annua]|uniref:General transcription factor IIH subunit 2 n=1 Tax=Artemisia annua TaxID=35608 RepID=A0A2U1L6H8_ARTAN|nr:general transcription factor II H2 [Artemisia annua]